jgi:predicted transposase/invertase (TIGR01784 family)
MDIVNNPHDKFFKQVLGDKETTRDFLTNYLPGDLLTVIDLESLVIQKESFIEKELQEHFSDLMYQVKIKDRQGYLYLLFEHKSYLYKATALQLLKYIVSFWEQKVNKEKTNTLPPVIPLVLYHGKEKWQLKHSLSSMIEGIEDLPEAVKRFIPNYEYLFFDFSPYSAAEIRGGVELRIFISILNAMFKEEEEFLSTVARSLQALEELGRGQKATDYLETMIRYIISAREDISYKEIHGAVKNVSPKGGEMLMTIAEKLRNEGKKEGLEEGMEKGLEMTLLALQAFREGKDLEEVMNLTGLERDILLKIQMQAFK